MVDDVRAGCPREEAGGSIRLIMLVNDVSLRNLIPGELAKGFGYFQSKPSSAFSPVAVTPDELGDAWDGSRVNLPLLISLNGEPFGQPEAGVDMVFDFPALIAHAAKTRPLCAGTIVGSGTVSNKGPTEGPARRSSRAERATPASPNSAPSKPSSTASRRRRFSNSATWCGSR